MADRQGFEPWIPFRGIHDFQSCAFDHSANSPWSRRCIIRNEKYYICFAGKCQAVFAHLLGKRMRQPGGKALNRERSCMRLSAYSPFRGRSAPNGRRNKLDDHQSMGVPSERRQRAFCQLCPVSAARRTFSSSTVIPRPGRVGFFSQPLAKSNPPSAVRYSKSPRPL